ncbi:hypothetical protein [Microcoleus sp. FACHB-672]|uniref:hypothetical protein n=1 Tax=Microcoleus sp. FACHB-672 TaxID=2692825 RepID=UPI001689E374|nr:hypothetical protein [Microcoleus sp. FACHB-672]MBD2041343.1 hypothetical protein [Microcoleus sp. FACHB-672]
MARYWLSPLSQPTLEPLAHRLEQWAYFGEDSTLNVAAKGGDWVVTEFLVIIF